MRGRGHRLGISSALTIGCLLLWGCVSTVQREAGDAHFRLKGKMGVLAFENRTQEETAGQSCRDLLESILIQRGIAVEAIQDSKKEKDEKLHHSSYVMTSEVFEEARSKKISSLITGTVYKYQYPSDRDGSARVGVTLRIVEVDSGKVVWQRTASSTIPGRGTLPECARKVLNDLVREMPWVQDERR